MKRKKWDETQGVTVVDTAEEARATTEDILPTFDVGDVDDIDFLEELNAMFEDKDDTDPLYELHTGKSYISGNNYVTELFDLSLLNRSTQSTENINTVVVPQVEKETFTLEDILNI